MTAVAAQPSSNNGRDAVNRPMTFCRETMIIMAIIKGPAANPFSTALQNRARMGSRGDSWMSRPSMVAMTMTE